MGLRGPYCENCPGNKPEHQLAVDAPKSIVFHIARKEYDPVTHDDRRVRQIAAEALSVMGITPDIQEVLTLNKAIEEGVACARSFYGRVCNPDDPDWLEESDAHDPRSNPKLFDVIIKDF